MYSNIHLKMINICKPLEYISNRSGLDDAIRVYAHKDKDKPQDLYFSTG